MKKVIFLPLIVLCMGLFSCNRITYLKWRIFGPPANVVIYDYSDYIDEAVNLDNLPEADENDFAVILNNAGDGVVITQYKGFAKVLRIPAVIQGFPVTEIGDSAFATRRKLSDGRRYTGLRQDDEGDARVISGIVIPDGIVNIGKYAFSNQEITSLILPESVQSIGDWAFSDCELLPSVSLPASLTSLGNYIFSGCEALASVTIPEGRLPGITIGTFQGCENLTEIVIPSSMTDIGSEAFSGSGITSVTVTGNNVKRIWRHAFSGCAFTSFEIPEGVEEIKEGAFAGCSFLTSVTFPSTIKEIEKKAFINCPALTTVIIPDSVASIQFTGAYDVSSRRRDGSDLLAFGDSDNLSLASQATLKRVGYDKNKYNFF